MFLSKFQHSKYIQCVLSQSENKSSCQQTKPIIITGQVPIRFHFYRYVYLLPPACPLDATPHAIITSNMSMLGKSNICPSPIDQISSCFIASDDHCASPVNTSYLTTCDFIYSCHAIVMVIWMT